MHLIRDVLDQRLIDRRRRPMGRVDGIVLEVRGRGRPRVVALESGLGTLARRLHPRLVPRVEALERRLGVSDGRPVRIPLEKMRGLGVDLELDVDGNDVDAWSWERWLRRWLVRRIPGGGS